MKSVPGYEEIFQLVPRASHENGDPEVGVCEQVKGGQSLGSDWSNISELVKINLSSALSLGSKDKYQRHWHFFTKFCNFFDRVLKNIVGTYATLSAKKLSTANTCFFKNVIRKKKIIKKNKLSSG